MQLQKRKKRKTQLWRLKSLREFYPKKRPCDFKQKEKKWPCENMKIYTWQFIYIHARISLKRSINLHAKTII